MKRLLTLVALLSALLAPSSWSTAAPATTSEMIVVVKAGRSARGLATAFGVTPRHVYITALNGFAAALTPQQRAGLARHPDVELLEADQPVQASGTQTIDPSGGLWGLDRIDQRGLPLSGSYTDNRNGAGVTVYVIDSGLQANHPDFGGRGQNVFDALSSSLIVPDCHGHGTHLASIVGGTTHGVAKQAHLRGVRVLDCNAQGTVANAIAGIDWVATNAHKPAVATLAFSPVNLTSGNSLTLQLAVENVIDSGVFVAVAAGNATADACTVVPANVAAAYTVAATTRTDARATFSNHGPCVDGYAPGTEISGAWIGSTTNTLSGTSASTGFVAGLATLYKATYTDAAQATINTWLNSSATPNSVSGNVGGTANRLLYADLVVAQTVIDSFDSGSIAGWQTYAGGGATINPSVRPPEQPGNYAMRLDYSVPPGGWVGVYRSFVPAYADWSSYSGLNFWYSGTGSGNLLSIELQDNGVPGSRTDTAERFLYQFTDSSSGWHNMTVPWSAFQRRSWQLVGAPNDGLTLTRVQGLVFAPQAGTGTLYLDYILLVSPAHPIVADFETSSAENWYSYAGDGASISSNITTPGHTGGYAMRINYNRPAGSWCGVGLAFQPAYRDWSSYSGLSFSLAGTGSGNPLYIELQDNDLPGSSTDTAERFLYQFTDSSSGWRTITVPWSAFQRGSWQPSGAPNDGLTLTRVYGLVFSANAGTGSFSLDQVQLTP